MLKYSFVVTLLFCVGAIVLCLFGHVGGHVPIIAIMSWQILYVLGFFNKEISELEEEIAKGKQEKREIYIYAFELHNDHICFIEYNTETNQEALVNINADGEAQFEGNPPSKVVRMTATSVSKMIKEFDLVTISEELIKAKNGKSDVMSYVDGIELVDLRGEGNE